MGRAVTVAVLILIQALSIVYITLYFASFSTFFTWGLTILSLGVVVWLVNRNENPSYKLAWVILILVAPIVGVLFYAIFGKKRLPERLNRQMSLYHKQLLPYLDGYRENAGELGARSSELGRQADYITHTTGCPVYRNTECAYFPLGEDLFPRLLEELEKAERFILMEYFIIEAGKMWDPIFEILQRKARDGVEVRLMYDDMGSIGTLPSDYSRTIEAAGIRCAVFNPFRPHLNGNLNYRDHRKICVIDGNVGFTGGINLADEYINAYPKHGHWKDTAVMLRGDAVWGLSTLFMELWSFTTGEAMEADHYRPAEHGRDDGFVQPYGDSPLDELNVAESVYMQIINSATRYIYITSPYLILDNEMVTALSIAAQSGVDVRIITPHHPDKWFVHPVTRSFYLPLIEAGVKIYEYTPGFIHAKMFVSDDRVAVVGTTNMDYRSFYLHFECGVAFYYSSIVDEVRRDILKTLEKCQAVTREWAYSTFPVRLGRAMLRVFAPLM